MEKGAKKAIDVSFADKTNNIGLFNNIDASKVIIDNKLNVSGTTKINNIKASFHKFISYNTWKFYYY